MRAKHLTYEYLDSVSSEYFRVLMRMIDSPSNPLTATRVALQINLAVDHPGIDTSNSHLVY